MKRILFLILYLFLLVGNTYTQTQKKTQGGFYYLVNSGGQNVPIYSKPPISKKCEGCPIVDYAIVGKISIMPFCSIKNIDTVEKVFTDQVTGVINLVLNKEGTEILKKVSKNNLYKQVAFVANGKIIAQPLFMEEIDDGKLQLTGNYSVEEIDKIIQIIKVEIGI